MRRILRIILFTGLVLAAAIDLCQSYGQTIYQLLDRTGIPLHSLGFQFIGLENVFKGVRAVGYYTDKDLDNPLAVAQFEQAQYMLAPTVLDLNHTQYRWAIFDCTSLRAAMEAAKRLGFTPLKTHNGIILAINPNGS